MAGAVPAKRIAPPLNAASVIPPFSPFPLKRAMNKTYSCPVLVELGAVEELTAALGSAPRPDFSVFPQIPASTGSFDICPNGTVGQC